LRIGWTKATTRKPERSWRKSLSLAPGLYEFASFDFGKNWRSALPDVWGADGWLLFFDLIK
jgi:hypothetical protein